MKDKPAPSLSTRTVQANSTGHPNSPDPPKLLKLCRLHHNFCKVELCPQGKEAARKGF